MLHIRDNFGNGPVSQVPASWFNSVAKFINNLVGGNGVEIEKFDDGTPSTINIVNSGGGGDPGVPTEVGSFPDDNVEQEEEVLWSRGDTDGEGKLIGANLMLVFKGVDDGNHLLYAAKLEIDPDGRISKIVAVENSGVMIYA